MLSLVPHCAANIARLFPNAKILMVLRDPAERAFSQYLHMLTFADSPISLRSYVDQCLNSSCTHIGELYPFLHFGFYAAHLERYRALFPPDRIQIYWYDDYRSNPTAMLRDIFQFLDVDPAFEPDLSQRYMEARVPRSYIVNRALKPVWARMKTVMPTAAARKLKRMVFRSREAMTMPEEDRAFLRSLYREDIHRLQQLTGRDLSHWQA